MATDRNWGHCKDCRYFASPASAPLEYEEAACQEPSFAKSELRVFGASGCNRFELRRGVPEAPRARAIRAVGASR